MDILSARKKAAERARAGQPGDAAAQGQPQPPAGASEPAAAPQEIPPVLPAAPAPSVSDSSTAAPEAVGHPVEALAFRLGNEEYAIPVERVREVTRVWEITAVPNTPPHVVGVTSLRGSVLPVVDLCPRLGVAAGARDEKSRIIVTDVHDEGTGVIVDRVTGMVRFSPDELRPVPDSLEQGAEFLRGIVRTGDRLTILLDVDRAIGT